MLEVSLVPRLFFAGEEKQPDTICLRIPRIAVILDIIYCTLALRKPDYFLLEILRMHETDCIRLFFLLAKKRPGNCNDHEKNSLRQTFSDNFSPEKSVCSLNRNQWHAHCDCYYNTTISV